MFIDFMHQQPSTAVLSKKHLDINGYVLAEKSCHANMQTENDDNLLGSLIEQLIVYNAG